MENNIKNISDFHKGQMDHMHNLMKPKDCPRCQNTGVTPVANGPDDVEEEFCGCPKGQELMKSNNKV